MKNALYMARKKVYFSSVDDNVTDIAQTLHEKNIGSIIVKDRKNKDIGIITVGDILRLVSSKKDISLLKAKDIMSSPLICVDENSNIESLPDLINEFRLTRLVLKNIAGEITGIIRDKSLHKYLLYRQVTESIKDVRDSEVIRNFY